MEKLHTKAQGIILCPHLATALLYDVSRRWSLYLNRCVAASASKALEATWAIIPFWLNPILVELESGCYVGPILPEPLVDLLAGLRLTIGGRNSCGISRSKGGGIKRGRKRRLCFGGKRKEG